MTEKQEEYRKALIRAIHTSRGYRERIDVGGKELWREYLQNMYNVDSSKKLSIEELNNLLFILKGQTTEIKKGGYRPAPEGKITEKQLKAIEAIWEARAREKTPLALREFVDKTIKRKPLYLTSLTKQEATKIITAIKKL